MRGYSQNLNPIRPIWNPPGSECAKILAPRTIELRQRKLGKNLGPSVKGIHLSPRELTTRSLCCKRNRQYFIGLALAPHSKATVMGWVPRGVRQHLHISQFNLRRWTALIDSGTAQVPITSNGVWLPHRLALTPLLAATSAGTRLLPEDPIAFRVKKLSPPSLQLGIVRRSSTSGSHEGCRVPPPDTPEAAKQISSRTPAASPRANKTTSVHEAGGGERLHCCFETPGAGVAHRGEKPGRRVRRSRGKKPVHRNCSRLALEAGNMARVVG